MDVNGLCQMTSRVMRTRPWMRCGRESKPKNNHRNLTRFKATSFQDTAQECPHRRVHPRRERGDLLHRPRGRERS